MFSIGGRWIGYYIDDQGATSIQVPLVATLRVNRNLIEGEMLDEPRETRFRYAEAFARDRDRLSPAQRDLGETILARDPESILIMQMPPRSRLEGHIYGEDVLLTKRYEGERVTEMLCAGQRFAFNRMACDPVVYSGKINSQGNLLVGRWKILVPGLLGAVKPPVAQGLFRFEKE